MLPRSKHAWSRSTVASSSPSRRQQLLQQGRRVVPKNASSHASTGKVKVIRLIQSVAVVLIVLAFAVWIWLAVSFSQVSSSTVVDLGVAHSNAGGSRSKTGWTHAIRRNCTVSTIPDSTTRLTERPCKPIVVAYAVSLIKCGDFQSTPEGLVDAALVMRHSIHHTSSRVGASDYDYKMYAIVHADAQPCSHILKDAGFQVLVRQRPVEQKDIRGSVLRETIHKEWCCGHDEFIKLYAYTLPEPVVVHVDIDFVFHKPMDHVFDALLYHKDSDIGRAARQSIELERSTDAWPDEPQAFMTRDWGQVYPGRLAGFQAGFIVLRSNPKVMDELVEIIKEGHYVDGFGRDNGWGGKGYGGFVGAKAMQGLIAYYYDVVAPHTWVELNQCRYNHMGMDVRFNPGGPGYRPKHKGKCRNGQDDCEDCMHTNATRSVYNIHYTQCRKPWMCIGVGDSTLKGKRKVTRDEKNLIPQGNVHIEHCFELLQIWHTFRTRLEDELNRTILESHHHSSNGSATESIVPVIEKARRGSFKTSVFQGHCLQNGEYLRLAAGHKKTLRRISQLYDEEMANP